MNHNASKHKEKKKDDDNEDHSEQSKSTQGTKKEMLKQIIQEESLEYAKEINPIDREIEQETRIESNESSEDIYDL